MEGSVMNEIKQSVGGSLQSEWYLRAPQELRNDVRQIFDRHS